MNSSESEKMKAIEQQVLSQNLMNFKNQLSTINVQLEELVRLKESLSELEGMKERKTHVSIGNGIFLEATLNEQKEVLMNVGANILVKKEFGKAIEIIDKQTGELRKIFVQMTKEIEKIELRLTA